MTDLLLINQRLRDDWKQLQSQWNVTDILWLDAVKERFKQEYWQNYDQTIPPLFREIENLHNIVIKAQRDLG